MIIIAIVISIFFIVVIAILCKSYTKDIFELENRLLQLEKRINKCERNEKEVDDMACKKGHGGRKK